MTRVLLWAGVLLGLLMAVWLIVGQPDEDVAPPIEAAPTPDPFVEDDLLAPLPEYEPPPATRSDPADDDESLPTLVGIEGTPLTVRVVDPEGVPVPRSVLRVERGSDAESKEELLWIQDGRAEVERAHAGQVLHLVVEHPVDTDGVPLALLARRLSNVPPDTAEVEIALPRSRRLRGSVVDLDGHPVLDVAIRAQPSGRPSDARTARTTADGRFEIRGLPDEKVELWVPVEEPWLLLPCVIPAAQGDVHLELVPKASLAVEILGDDGIPVEGVQVLVSWAFEEIPFSRSDTTDAQGLLKVLGVPTNATFAVRTGLPRRTAGHPDVSLRDLPYGDGTIQVRLPPSVSLAGTVTDPTGQAVTSGRVEVAGADPWSRGVTRQGALKNGRFRVDHLGPGRYRLVVDPKTGRYAPHAWILVEAPAHDIRIVLHPRVVATGTVSGPDPREVVIQWFPPQGSSRRASIDEAGHWKISSLADLPGTVYAWRAGTTDVCLIENVKPTERSFVIRLEPGLSIAGRIRGYAHDPSRRLHARLVRGPLTIPLRVGKDGVFERTGIPAGSWRVEVLDNDMQPVSSVEADAGRTDVELRLP